MAQYSPYREDLKSVKTRTGQGESLIEVLQARAAAVPVDKDSKSLIGKRTLHRGDLLSP
jgi:hypothetical protein